MSEKKAVCAGCPQLEVKRDKRGWPKPGEVGYCILRDTPIENIEDTWCANHPERNFLCFPVRVGPVWAGNLPVVLDGVPVREEGAGDPCAECGEAAPGPEIIVWLKDEKRSTFCSSECYMKWGREKDPAVPGGNEVEAEDRSEVRRLYRALCDAEEDLKAGRKRKVEALRSMLDFASPALYRLLRAKGWLPKSPLEESWPGLMRGGPKETRGRANPRVLEVQLAVCEMLSEPLEGVPREAAARAYEYARIRWARMVVGDLVEAREGPGVPEDVDRRFRGHHRPEWREGETSIPANARRLFYLERNPDLKKQLEAHFGAASSAD